MKRVMCIFLPAWPLQRLVHERPELRGKALALATAHDSRPSILCCSRAAARAGIRPGMPVAEAVAIDPALLIEEEDLAGDRRALEQLAAWAERYSPLVGLEEGAAPRSLLLDVTGCAACFRGEDNLLRLAEREWAEQNWVARLALADTLGAAWGLAHYGDNTCNRGFAPLGLGHPATHSSFSIPHSSFSSLPLAALRLPAETVRLLASLGIERIEQLEALPRESLPARFGSQVLLRLDQALGRVAEVIEPHRFLPDVRAECSLDYPVESLWELQQLVDRLAVQIHEGLCKRNQGARQVECWLYHEAASPERLEIGLSQPHQSDRYLAELLRIRLEQTRLKAPVSGLSLRVLLAEPIGHDQTEFFDTGERRGVSPPCSAQKDLAALIDRLSGRLGRDAVARAVLVPDPQPEYACNFETWIQPGVTRAARPERSQRRGKYAHHALRFAQGVPPTAHQSPDYSRPLRLRQPAAMDVVSVVPDGPPLRFTWDHVDYIVARSWGPERIEAGWWRGQDVRRDYYVVATQLGNRFWLFRRPADGRWFLHGSFD